MITSYTYVISEMSLNLKIQHENDLITAVKLRTALNSGI